MTLTEIAYHDSYDIREMGVFAFKYLHEKGSECKEIKQRKKLHVNRTASLILIKPDFCAIHVC